MTHVPPYAPVQQANIRDIARGRRRFFLAMLLFVWIPVALAFSAGISFLAAVILPYFGLLLGPAFSLFAAYAVKRNLDVQRERRSLTILGYLENAIRLNLPLDKFLLAAEQSERGKTCRRLYALRSALAGGHSISTALEAAVPEIAQSTLTLLQREESIGQLQPALTRLLLRTRSHRPTAIEDNHHFYRFYLICVVGFLLTVMTGMMIFVVPKFRDIFKDFHTNLPDSTQFLINVADFMANSYIGTALVIAVAVLVVVCIGRVVQSVFTPTLGYFFPADFYQWITWNTPFSHRLQRDGALADIFTYLSDAIRAGLPLHTAVNNATQLHMNYHMRHRLLQWRSNLELGQSPAIAARSAGFPALLVGLLQPGETSRAITTTTSTPELFDFLARYYRQRFSSLLLWLRGATEPFVVLFLGAAIGFFVYAFFTPLVSLIASVADQSFNSGAL